MTDFPSDTSNEFLVRKPRPPSGETGLFRAPTPTPCYNPLVFRLKRDCLLSRGRHKHCSFAHFSVRLEVLMARKRVSVPSDAELAEPAPIILRAGCNSSLTGYGQNILRIYVLDGTYPDEVKRLFKNGRRPRILFLSSPVSWTDRFEVRPDADPAKKDSFEVVQILR